MTLAGSPTSTTDSAFSVPFWRAMSSAEWTIEPPSSWSTSYPLVNAENGRLTDVKPVRIGDEKVTVAGKQITATHYRLVARTPREIWYDASGRWVKMTTTVRDGSLVEWVLK
jgi:hypothetical protein